LDDSRQWLLLKFPITHLVSGLEWSRFLLLIEFESNDENDWNCLGNFPIESFLDVCLIEFDQATGRGLTFEASQFKKILALQVDSRLNGRK